MLGRLNWSLEEFLNLRTRFLAGEKMDEEIIQEIGEVAEQRPQESEKFLGPVRGYIPEYKSIFDE